jgi:uncharacterized damage-inducible protein DinB
MAPDSIAIAYPDWPQHATRLAATVGRLSDEQLALRAGPDHLPIWGLAAHTAGARAYWICDVFKEPGADSTPFGDPLPDLGWEDDETHPRSAEELVLALDSTWALIADVLERWTIPMLGETVERRYRESVQIHSRGSMLNRLFTHDAYHAGEISQILGVHGLDAIDLWRKA